MTQPSVLQPALTRYHAGDMAQAHALVAAVLADTPRMPEAMNLMALIEFQRGERGAALKWFRQAVEAAPQDANIRFNYAKAAQATGAASLARSLLTQAVADDANHRAAHHALVLAHWDNDDLAAAEAVCRAAVAKWPQAADLLVQMGALLFATDRWHEAVDYAQRAVNAAPTDAMAQRLLGERLAAVGRYSEAVAVLKTCAENPATPKTSLESLHDMAKDAGMLARLVPEMRVAVPEDVSPAQHDELTAAVAAHQSPSSNTPTFVFFHVAGHERHPFLAEGRGAAVDYASTLAWACRAARATNPGWRIVILSDAATSFASLPDGCDIMQLPVDPSRLMYSRMRAYRALLQGTQIDAPMAFLDTDVCVNLALLPLFDGGFDVGLTYRTNQFHMPVNEGVIFGANGSSPALAAFFDRCLAYYDALPEQPSVQERYPFDARMWRGGQLSLAAFVDWRVPPLAKADELLHGVRCRFFPCEEYNYPVATGDTPQMLAKKSAIHFKGSAAKQAMSAFAANLVANAAKR